MKAGEAGGVEAIVKAISRHVCNAGVCEMGCGVLWDMIASNGKIQ